MAGQLTLSTLNDSSGVLAAQNGMNGIPKAWVAFNASTSSVIASFNVQSLSKTAVGKFTINFITTMPNSNYGISGNMNNSANVLATSGAFVVEQDSAIPPTSSNVSVVLHRSTIAFVDPTYASVVVYD